VPAQCVPPEALQAAETHNYAAATRPGYRWDNLQAERQMTQMDIDKGRKEN